MPATIELPKKSDPDALIRVMNNGIAQVEQNRNPNSVEWLINFWYMKGARGFKRLNFMKGSIDGQIAFEDRQGKLRFKYEGALPAVQKMQGQLDNMDLGPAIESRPFSLDAQRRNAAAKVWFDNVFPPDKVNDIAKLAKQAILHYGIIGLIPEFHTWPDGTTAYSISTINPWELGCLPVNVTHPNEAAVITRDRWVSLDWLRAQKQFKVPADTSEKDMETVEVQFGNTPRRKHGPTGVAVVADTVRGAFNRSGSKDSGRMTSPHVRLIEYYVKGLQGPNGYTWKRYVAKVGKVILHDETFGDEAWAKKNPDIPMPPPFPIGIANWYEVGFYGRSFLSPIVQITNEVEENLSAFFRNVAKMDGFGYLLVPDGMQLDIKRLKHQDGLGIITFGSDPLSPDKQPIPLNPVTSGSAPAQAAQLALQLVKEMTGGGGVIGGDIKRLDSQNAIESAFNIQRIPLAGPARSLSEAFATVYRAILYEGRIRFTKADKLELVSFEEAAAGLKISADGNVELDKTGLPWPHQVRVNVRNSSVEEKTNQQEESLEALVAGIITPTQFWIQNFQKELKYLPGINDDIRGQVQKGQLNNLTLYSDGKTVGTFIFNPQSDNANILLPVLNAFMAQTIWSLASVEVREGFESYKRILIESTGGEFPEQIQNAENAATQQSELVAALQQQQAQQQAQQGQPQQPQQPQQ